MFATLAVLAARLSTKPASGCRRLARVALIVAALHVLSGGMIGAQFALTACPASLACPGADFGTLAATLDPLRPLDIADGRVRTVAGAAGLVLLHRGLAVAVLVLALAAAWSTRADRTLAATLAHNALAAILVAALAAAAFLRRVPALRPPDSRTG